MKLRNILSAGIVGFTLALVGCTSGSTDTGNGETNGDGTLTNRINGLFDDTGYTNYNGYGTNGYNTNGSANGYYNGYGTNGYKYGTNNGMNGASTITGNGYGYNNYTNGNTTRPMNGNYGYNTNGMTNYNGNSTSSSIDNDLKTVTSPLRGTTTNNNTANTTTSNNTTTSQTNTVK